MKHDEEERSAVVGIGTYVQHFERELCTEREYMDAKYVYKIIGTSEDPETGQMLVRLEKRFGNFHEVNIPIDDFFQEVDHEKYPYIKQKYVYEEIVKNEPMYPLHPEDSKFVPIDRYQAGKYKENDIILVNVSDTRVVRSFGGVQVRSTISKPTVKAMDEQFQTKIDRGVGFIMLPPNWYKLKRMGLASAEGAMTVNVLNPDNIVGVVLEIINDSIKVRIMQPGVFNRLVVDKETIRAIRRGFIDPNTKPLYRDDVITTVCYDLDLPSHYVIND